MTVSFWNSFTKRSDVELIQNDRYDLAYCELEQIKAGITILNPYKETRGHSHKNVEEVYYFIRGRGKMIKGNKNLNVKPGDLVLIEDGLFHKVINTENEKLEFVVVFNKTKEK